MQKRKNAIILMLVLCVVVSLFSGCGGTASEAHTAGSSEAQGSVAVQDSAAEISGPAKSDKGLASPALQIDESYNVPASSPVELPLTEETKSFSWFMEAPGGLGTVITDENENYAVIAMEEKTNVHFDYITPASDTAAEQFNILNASGEYPDVNSGVYDYYTSGLDSAIEEGIIIDLSSYIDEYTPNYTRFLDAFDAVNKAAWTDNGALWCFACISIDNPIQWGPMIRSDWLEETGLESPVTVADWEEILEAFKANGHANALALRDNGFPCAIGSEGVISSAFNVSPIGLDANNEFANIDGKIVFTPTADGYKQYLELMSDWYSRDLVYKDLIGMGGVSDLVMDDKVGLFVWNSGDLENLNAEPVALPVLDEANPESHFYNFVKPASGGLCVGSLVPEEDLPVLLSWFNYHYSDEGAVLSNYGKEGVTFEYDENGMPMFTEFFYNNPKEGYTVGTLEDAWTMKYSGCMRIWQATYDIPTASDSPMIAAEIWAKYDADYVLPAISLTAEESGDVLTIQTDIETYVSEYTLHCVVGDYDVEETWDEYVESIEAMGLEKMVSVYQAALDRYMSK